MGGALRDLLLGKRPWDLDFAALDPLKAAREAQGRLGGSLFPLDEERGQYRLVSGRLILDFSPLLGTLEEDLLKRDFRLNAWPGRGGGSWGLGERTRT